MKSLERFAGFGNGEGQISESGRGVAELETWWRFPWRLKRQRKSVRCGWSRVWGDWREVMTSDVAINLLMWIINISKNWKNGLK